MMLASTTQDVRLAVTQYIHVHYTQCFRGHPEPSGIYKTRACGTIAILGPITALGALQPLHLHHFPVRADHQPQLAAFVLPKDPSPQCLGKEFVGRIVAVDEMLDLLVCHAIALFLAQPGFLLQSPLVDVLRVLGIDVDEGVKLIGDVVVGFEGGVDILDAGEGVVTEAAVVARWIAACSFGGGFPLLAQGGLGKGTEADGPAFEEDDFYGGLARAVDAFPLGLWNAVALAGEGGFVVLWDGSWLVLEEGLEDGEGEGDVVG